jgi:hypothetical protein
LSFDASELLDAVPAAYGWRVLWPLPAGPIAAKTTKSATRVAEPIIRTARTGCRLRALVAGRVMEADGPGALGWELAGARPSHCGWSLWALRDLDDRWFGIHEEQVKDRPDGVQAITHLGGDAGRRVLLTG